MSDFRKTLVQERLLTSFVKSNLSIEEVQLLVTRLNRINEKRILKREQERLAEQKKTETIASYESQLRVDGLSLEQLVLFLKKT